MRIEPEADWFWNLTELMVLLAVSGNVNGCHVVARFVMVNVEEPLV